MAAKKKAPSPQADQLRAIADIMTDILGKLQNLSLESVTTARTRLQAYPDKLRTIADALDGGDVPAPVCPGAPDTADAPQPDAKSA